MLVTDRQKFRSQRTLTVTRDIQIALRVL